MSNGINIDLTANLARWTSSLDRATQDLNRFQTNTQRIAGNINSAFSGLGAIIGVGTFSALIKGSIDAADALSKMADKTGIAVEQLNGLDYAAKLSDTSIETVGLAVNKLSVFIAKNGESARALGITSKDNAEAFAQLSDALVGIEDAQTRAAVATGILGRGWQELAPLLLQGGNAIREQVSAGQELNPVTAEMARLSADLNDKFTTLQTKIGGVATVMAGPIVNSFTAFIGYIEETNTQISGASALFSAFEFIIKGVAKTVAAADDIFNRAGLGIGALAAKLGAVARLDFKGVGVIDDAFKDDISRASKRYDDFVKNLDNPKSSGSLKKSVSQTSTAAVNSVLKLSEDGAASGNAKNKSISSRGSSARVEDGSRELENLNRQIALLGVVTEAERIRYETTQGALKNISSLRKQQLITSAEELDSQNEFNDILKQGDDIAKTQSIAINQATKDAEQLKIALSDFTPPASNDFEQRLYKIDDALKSGIFSAKEAKIEFDKLGTAFNDGKFSENGEKSISQLSVFAEQAAKNMESSFANFLFDPFKDGVSGLADNFGTAIRRMSAEYLSSAFFELLTGKNKNGGNLFDNLSSQIGSFGSLFSGLFSGSGSSPFNGTGPQLSFAGQGTGSGSGFGSTITSLLGILTSFFHEGGTVGAVGGSMSMVSPHLFSAAQRFHSGGIIGSLKSDEVPAILQKGEIVLSKNQLNKQKSQGPMNIIVNISGNQSAPDVRRSAAQGAREGLSALSGAQRYG
jgi:hypothetical protein